jgi:hypothetical protein
MSDASSSSAITPSIMSSSSSRQLYSSSQLIQEYISTLTLFEQKGLTIAIDHLGPSFDMKRSSGFVRWKENRDAIQQR